MKKFSASTIRATALLVATSGAATATVLANQPAPAPDRSATAGIERLANALGSEPGDVKLPPMPMPGPTTPLSFTPAVRKQKAAAPAHYWHPPVLPAVDGTRVAGAKTGSVKTVTAPVVPFSPVANVALLGVTERGGVETAWLVDTQNGQRELVSQGERAHGLTVKQIGPDSVTLSGDGKQYTLRLGEKRIETASTPSANNVVAENAEPAPANRWGNGGNSRARARNRGGGFGGGFGGGNVAGGSFGGGSFGGGNSGNRSSMANNFGVGRAARQMASAAFGGNGAFGGGNQSGSASMTSAFSSQSTAPTSNPQTARRENTRLVGGEAPLPVPTALANPQTTRRTGSGGSNTPAFGQASGTVGSALSQFGPSGNGRANRVAPVQ